MNCQDKAIAILGATQDGEHLAPIHLGLVEAAVNHGLNERGEIAFEALYRRVISGQYDYRKEWLFGIENLRKDHHGYVYWRDALVEHYSHQSVDHERSAAHALAAACRSLEKRGFKVTGNVLGRKEYLLSTTASDPLCLGLLRLYCAFAKDGRIALIFFRERQGGEDRAVIAVKQGDALSTDQTGDPYDLFHALQNSGWSPVKTPQTYEQMTALFNESGFTAQDVRRAVHS